MTPTAAQFPTVENVIALDPRTLRESPFHQRTRWGDMKGFAQSTKDVSTLQPVIVRWVTDVEEGEEPYFEIVLGHRRVRGAIKADADDVPCIVRDYLDEEVIEVQARENMEREDLHPLDEAEYFQLLLQQGGGWDRRLLCKRFSRSPKWVGQRLQLLALSPNARKAFGADKISFRQALLAASLPLRAQQEALVGAIVDKSIEGDDAAAAWVRTHAMVPLEDAPWSLDDRAMPGGSCTECTKRTGVQGDMFEGVTADDRCLDPSCWRGKADRATEIQIETTKLGRMTDAPDRVFLPMLGAKRPAVIKSSGYVEAIDECDLVPGKTWIEAAIAAGVNVGPAEEGDRERDPVTVIGQDQSRRPRTLLVRDRVEPAILRAIREEKPAMRSAPATTGPMADPARAQAAAATKARRAAEDRLLAGLVEEPAPETACNILPIVGKLVSTSSIKRVAKACGVETADALLTTDNPSVAIRRIYTLIVAEVGLGEPTTHPEIVTLAKGLGVSLARKETA
jgi:ParB/RepB/Spo0J family partition protein